MTEGESAENTAGGAESTAGGAVPKTLIYGQIWNKKVKKYGIYLT